MRFTLIAALCSLLVSPVSAAIKTQTVEYKAGETTLKGYLAYDDSSNAKRPGILVVPEWWGLTDYPKHRAEQLAELGYVGFAIDMYGDGKTTDDPKQAGAWAGQVNKNPQLEKDRINAAIETLKNQPMVNRDQLAAIGYCFGGGVVLDMARLNEPLKGVVSFHGELSSSTPTPDKIQPKILVLTGGADKFVPAEQVRRFEQEMKKTGADYKVVTYPGAHHAFTNPNADSYHMDNVKYDPQADKQSWAAMKQFLADLFK